MLFQPKGNTIAICLGAVLLLGVLYSAPNGITASFYAEMFSAKVRTVSIALGMQLGLVLYGFAPMIAQALGGGSSKWLPAAILAGVGAVIAAISAGTAKETYKTPLAEVGQAGVR